MGRSAGIARTGAPATQASRTATSADGAADGAGVCLRLGDCCSSLAAFRSAPGEPTRICRRSWRRPSRSVISCLACALRRSRRARTQFRSPCRARRPHSPRQISTPARPAISISATSTSAIASRREIRWRSSQCRSSTIRFRRTRRRSISSSRRWIRRRRA
jgi:hypothetical protein